jgi:DNA processing protein
MEHLPPWFELKKVSGIGNLLYKRLIDTFKSPEHVFGASAAELTRVDGITSSLAEIILSRPFSDKTRHYIDRVREKGFGIVTMTDHDYPHLLREIPDPPPYLYFFGKLTPGIGNIAVVGSRNATAYGLAATQKLCRELASRHIAVVSGMARGIDTAAHLGAIAEKGETIAVLGSSLDRVYPRENTKLFHRIAENGAVITEFDLETDPEPHHFPLRNRIISGMSLGTVVVEAAKKSGSLITARLSAEQNREVFAVPGSIDSGKSEGTHALIKQGAKLVQNIDDILDEFSYLFRNDVISDKPKKSEKTHKFSDEEYSVIRAIGPYPLHIDDIIRKTALSPGRLSSILLQLELSGVIRQTPGKFFCMAEDVNI